jgi:transposase-like protein
MTLRHRSAWIQVRLPRLAQSPGEGAGNVVVDTRALAKVNRALERLADVELRELVSGYPSEEACRAYVERVRWPNGVSCPRCDASRGISRIESRGQFECDSCGYQFSVTAGTAFHGSHLPLSTWLLALELVGRSQDGITADRLGRLLGVSYKTAWYLSRRIRAATRGSDASSQRVGFGGMVRLMIGADSAGSRRLVRA